MKVYSYNYKPNNGKNPIIGKKRIKRPKGGKKRFLLTWTFRLIAIGVVFTALLFLYYAKDLPDPNKLLERQVAESTKIFDRDGGLIYEIHGEVKRTLIELSDIPQYAIDATIALEDKDFYKHRGISITGILRSAVRYVINRGPSGGGGSTITQQFVKNAILSNKKTLDRKLREAILSIAIEARLKKDKILKLYLNEIPYGRNAYGIEAAAESYFGKKAKKLTLAESAYLAALPQAPTFYNPLGPNRKSLDNRKNITLRLMREQGYITKKEEEIAKNKKVKFLKSRTALFAPHFVLMVQGYLADKYGEKTLEEGGLKVYTTLDSRLQKIAEEAVKIGVERSSKLYNGYNAGLVAIDPKTGQILAMVGSKDYFGSPLPEGCTPGKDCQFEPNVNVTLSQRQPGSSFKPYVYVTAFSKEQGYNPATMLVDVVTNFGKYGGKDYIPRNYDGSERGPVSMRQALAGSMNIPAVKTLSLVGVGNAVQTARNLGITSPLSNCGLSLVLGGCEVRLLDHVAAFGVLANGGVKNEKTPILKILDKNDRVLEEFKKNSKKILDPQAVYQLVNIMSDNKARSFIFGPNSKLNIPGRPVAAKTGTTQKWHDGWTLGFTPSLVAGVWVGNNDGTFMKARAGGSTVAAPIWNQFMTEALKDTPIEKFEVPEGITKVLVEKVSGKLPTQYSPSTKEEIFASYNVPTEYDDLNVAVPMDSLTGQVATSATPPERIFFKTFTNLHSQRPNNPNWENPVRKWALKKGYQYPPTLNIDITNPGNQDQGQPPNIDIISPRQDSSFSGPPYKINVVTSGEQEIVKIDLFIDGQFITSKNSQPYNFFLNQSFSEGRHTIAVKATGLNGKTSDNSVSVIFGIDVPLNLVEPSGNSLVIFPLTITAESSKFYSDVNFYYLDENGEEKNLGKAGSAQNLGNSYRYSLKLNKSFGSGKYQLFAKTSNGRQTKKITITIP